MPVVTSTTWCGGSAAVGTFTVMSAVSQPCCVPPVSHVKESALELELLGEMRDHE
jgi:hypothetical protein